MSGQLPPTTSKSFIYFDPDMALYEPFMKNPDGSRLDAAGSGTRLEPALTDLARAWRGTHYARGMPYLVVRAGIDGAAGALQRELPEFTGSMLLDGLRKRMHQTHLRVRDRRELIRAIDDVRSELKEKLAQERAAPPTEADYQRAWKSYLGLHAFIIGLEASEISAYLALYFAYENFIARCVEVRSGTWPTSTRRIGDGFKAEFGSAAWTTWWDTGIVAAARHTRDAFAHRGGRANGDTGTFSAYLKVDAGCILIGASDTNALYRGLFDAVLGVAGEFCRLEGTTPTPPAGSAANAP